MHACVGNLNCRCIRHPMNLDDNMSSSSLSSRRSNGDGARDGRGDRLQGPRGQQPQHFLGYDPRDEHPAKQRIQQPLVYREQRGAFPQDGSPYGSPAQPFSRPEPRHPPHFDSQPPYLAPHPAQLRDAQGPGHVIGGYAQQQRRQGVFLNQRRFPNDKNAWQQISLSRIMFSRDDVAFCL